MSTDLVLTPSFHPSVYNHDRHDKVSSRYTVVETDTITSAVADDGWFPTSIKTVRSPSQFSKHLLRFHNDRYPRDRDNDLPEMVVGNSHDRTGALLVAIGLNVFVCSNGLISAKEGTFFKLKHVGLTMERVLNAIVKLATQIPELIERKTWLKSIVTTEQESIEFASRVIDLRFDGEKYKVNPADLLSGRLPAQSEPNLWNDYQTVQRHLINGDGLRVQAVGAKKPRKVRGLTRITENVRINQALDLATSNFAAELGYTF